MTRNYYTEISVDQPTVELLDGLSFQFFDFKTLATSGVQEYLLEVPSGVVDTVFYGRSFSGRGANLKYEVFSSPTFSSEGAAMPSRISNRNGDFVGGNQAMIWQNPTLITDGTLADYDEVPGTSFGNVGSAGSSASQGFPIILVKNSYMMVRITNLSSNVPGNYVLKWYWSELEK